MAKGGVESFGAPAYWNGHVNYFLSGDVLRDYRLENGRLSQEPLARGKPQFTDPGATPTVSENGTKNGIVWVLSQKTGDGPDRNAVLYEHEAENVANLLYTSQQKYERDSAGPALRFSIPTVANGHGYIGTKKHLEVYGLLPSKKAPH